MGADQKSFFEGSQKAVFEQSAPGQNDNIFMAKHRSSRSQKPTWNQEEGQEEGTAGPRALGDRECSLPSTVLAVTV